MPAQQHREAAARGLPARGTLEWRLWLARAYAAFVGLLVCLSGVVFIAPFVLVPGVGTGPAPNLPAQTDTALGAALGGAALRFAVFDRRTWVLRGFRVVCSLAVLALGVATFAGHVLVIDLGVDRLLGAGVPDRMSPLTATCVALLGLALAGLDVRTRRGTCLAPWLAIVVIVVAGSVFVGHGFGMHPRYEVAPYAAMTWSTSMVLILLAIGVVMARPDVGPARSFLRDGPGGFTIRRLVPTATALAFFLGLFIDTAHGAGLYDHAFAMAVLLVAIVTMLIVLVWSHADQVDRLDSRARAAAEERAHLLVRERASRASAEAAERRFRDLVEGLSEFVWERDAESLRFVFVSERATRILGHPVQRWLEEPELWERSVLHPEDRSRVLAHYCHPPAQSVGNDIEYRALTADGRVVWLRDTMRISTSERGTLLRGISIDVTEARRAGQRRAAQYAVTRILAETEELEAATTEILRSLCGCLGWNVAGLWLVDPDGSTLSCVGALETGGSSAEPFRRASLGRRFARGEGLPGRVWEEGRAHWIRDVGHEENFPRRGVAQSVGLHGAVAFPIRLGTETLGAIEFFSREALEPDHDMLDMMTAVGSQIGIFIERKRAEEQLRRSRDQAEAESRAKDEFLAMLGHELRNPIGAISNSIRAIEVGGLTPERQQTLQRIVARQTRRLARLVDDLLDVARLTRGAIELRREPTSLREVVAHACESFRANGVLRHEVVVTGDDVRVDGDPARLEQILGNLLDNAARYTPETGRIEIAMTREGEEAVVRVADTGQGIEPEVLPRLFDLFTRGRPPLRQAAAGLGIGLTLVKRLVELHGGSIEASSDGPGRGSVFTMRFPALPLATLPETELEEQDPGSPAVPLRVLVVEDYEDARETLRTLLEFRGHRVETAANGPEGLDKALALRPEVAILDIGLDGMDGYELGRRIREALGTKVFLVSLTGYGSLDPSRVPPDTFDGQLVKPLDPRALGALLEQLGKEGSSRLRPARRTTESTQSGS